MHKYILLTLILISVSIQPSIGAFAQDDSSTIIDVIVDANKSEEPEFVSLFTVLTLAQKVSDFSDPEMEFTLFAPTDEAFDILLEELDIVLPELAMDGENLEQIVLYHAVEGILLAEDLAQLESVTTLQGGDISISVNSDGDILLNDTIMITSTDMIASNGVIHTIDAIILPPEQTSINLDAITSEISNEPVPECFVTATAADTARVRVGPGNNRTAITFLPIDTEFLAQGQSEDDDGIVWYKLDKEEAAPGSAINEAWVSSEELELSGDCDGILESSAPPIIPITSRPSSPDGTTGDAVAGDVIVPTSGTYTLVLNERFDASCENIPNVSIETNRVFGTTVIGAVVVASEGSISLDGDIAYYDAQNQHYLGTYTIFDDVHTTIIYPQTATSFTGKLIISFPGEGGVWCSATVLFSASKA